MTRVAARTVLFADLRGSTGLYERIGNTSATRIVTGRIARLVDAVAAAGGTLVKTLGDGLMATFDAAADALSAADAMQRTASALELNGALPLHAGPTSLTLQIALASGEVVELGGDCYGDAVNVAARLIEHAGDHEILATAETVALLPVASRQRFRSLDQIRLRGRNEPVHVHLLAPSRGSDFAATRLEAIEPERSDAQGIRLGWLDRQQIWPPSRLPVLFGRSPEAAFCVEDSRVSRLHARIDWHGGTFRLCDLSYNGSFICFDHDPEIVTLRRSQCTLHGSGTISLGSPPADSSAPQLRFEVLRFADTEPMTAALDPPPALDARGGRG